MTADDEQGRELREQLDRELAGLVPPPHLLHEVLAGRRPEPARRGPGGPPAWFLAAAAVLVVALAVPVLRGTVFAGPGARDRVASSSLAPTVAPPPVLPPTPRASPTQTPSPAPSSRRSTATPRVPATATPVSCATSPAPGGAGRTASYDLDGDGTLDAVTATGTALSVQLSGSGRATVVLPSAGASVLPVPTARGLQLLVLSPGSIGAGVTGLQGRLYLARSCSLSPVLNAQGSPYVFLVGSNAKDSARSGVACDGSTLYGVTSARTADGTGWTVTRTPVATASGRAVNGAPTTEAVPSDDPSVDGLRTASCGAALPVPLS